MKRGRRFKKISFLKKLIWLIAGGFLVVLLFGFLIIFSLSRDLPSISQISNRQIVESTKIYDRTGQVLLYEISNGERRTVVAIEDIPQYLKDATVVVEDEKFYEEPGFSPQGILRALFVNLTHGRILQGGSTITQQLARNALLTPEQTVSRKIKEFILAIKLTRYYTKDQILALYLNEIPYGPTIYGVEAASRAYFNKPASGLSLAESAILAALPRAPSYYSPWGNHKKELFQREQFILNKMFNSGKISKRHLEEALKTKIAFEPQAQTIKAPHFVIAVQDVLVQKYGEDLVRSGGLGVLTTLDWDLEQLAEKVVAEGSLRNEKLYQGKNAALVAQDPKTGQVLALVGSRDYFDIKNEGNFNVATQGLRQPGSALKPFVYLTAFKKGYTPNTVVFDVPTNFDTTGDPEKKYEPKNFDEKFRGPVSFKQGLAQSLNVPSVKVLYLAGVQDTIKTLHDFGVTTLNEYGRYGLSLVLGGGEVKLIDLVGAYSVLSAEGVLHKQTMILEVRDRRGEILESYKDQSREVIDPEYPRLVNNILSDTEARSDLYQNSLYLTVFPDHDVALKTGTSNDYRDAWTFGYTPTLTVGVWAGNNDNSPMQKQGSSILAALPMWHEFMVGALRLEPPDTFNKPAPLTVQKSILAGDYSSAGIHSLLYYINPKDPLGPPPLNPEDNPQFKNWEAPVLEWAKGNLQGFLSSNQTTLFTDVQKANLIHSSAPRVKIEEPSLGSFIDSQISVKATIQGDAVLAQIGVYFNNKLIRELKSGLGNSYSLNLAFVPPDPELQNLLVVKALDQNNKTGEASVIVYK